MALTESRPLFIRLTLPDGLEEALEGLAREVLRHQPENILDFAANHFDQLLKKRGTSAKKNEPFENGINHDLQSIEDEDGIELETIEENEPSPRETAVKDNATPFNENENGRTSIDVQMPISKNEEDEEADNDLSENDGKTKLTDDNVETVTNGENKQIIDIDLNDPDVELAATKIQAGFKGMKSRKETSELKRQTNLVDGQNSELEKEPSKIATVDNIDID